MNNIKMLHFDRIDVSEGIDVNKTCASKECDICHYWCFLDYSFKFQPNVCSRCHDLLIMYSFKFQPNVCNRCHDLLIMSMNLADITILHIKGSDF